MSYRTTTFLFYLLLLTSLTAQVGGETDFQRRFNGPFSGARQGSSVTAVGDLNGDGLGDFAFLLYGGLGSFRVVAGGSWQTLFEAAATGSDRMITPLVGVGDLDGDGLGDLATVEYEHNALGYTDEVIHVYSGATGQIIRRYDETNVPVELRDSRPAGAGDVDGDGRDDIIIGAPNQDSHGFSKAGAAIVLSGATGNLLHHIQGWSDDLYMGVAVDGAGDLDSDGFGDFLVSVPYTSIPGIGYRAGTVFAISGLDGRRIYRFNGRELGAGLGTSLAGLDDLDGDGTPDFIMSETGANVGSMGSVGAARVVSGATGDQLYFLEGNSYLAYFGSSCADAGDVDGDGVGDIVIGAPQDQHPIDRYGSFSIYSGATGILLSKEYGEGVNDYFGTSVAGIGDVDGDGDSEVLIGAPGADMSFTNAGAVYVYDFKPFLRSNTYTVSAALGGSVNFALDFPESAGGHEYKVLISATGMGPSTYGVEIPITMDYMAMNSLNGIYPFSNYVGLHGILSATSKASATITVTPGLPTGLIGRTFWFAAIAGPAGGLAEYSSAVVPISVTN
jgi:hypothetical protein